jgi:hypothetical protein
VNYSYLWPRYHSRSLPAAQSNLQVLKDNNKKPNASFEI